MEQEDFIKRQIEQLGQVLGKILNLLLGFKAKGQISEGIEIADQSLKNELGLNTDDLILIPTKSFITTLLEVRKFNDNNFDELAEILFIIAEEFNINNTEIKKMKKLYERSLIIYELLDKTSSTYSFDRHRKIEKIKNVL
ncbi:MAG: hypothetical protein NTY96_06030 [Bacteroidetes bacterium]|nr:hypothetical protein [Bacteroidota bacterium]